MNKWTVGEEPNVQQFNINLDSRVYFWEVVYPLHDIFSQSPSLDEVVEKVTGRS